MSYVDVTEEICLMINGTILNADDTLRHLFRYWNQGSNLVDNDKSYKIMNNSEIAFI